jgi:hypothetical protein
MRRRQHPTAPGASVAVDSVHRLDRQGRDGLTRSFGAHNRRDWCVAWEAPAVDSPPRRPATGSVSGDGRQYRGVAGRARRACGVVCEEPGRGARKHAGRTGGARPVRRNDPCPWARRSRTWAAAPDDFFRIWRGGVCRRAGWICHLGWSRWCGECIRASCTRSPTCASCRSRPRRWSGWCAGFR